MKQHALIVAGVPPSNLFDSLSNRSAVVICSFLSQMCFEVGRAMQQTAVKPVDHQVDSANFLCNYCRRPRALLLLGTLSRQVTWAAEGKTPLFRDVGVRLVDALQLSNLLSMRRFARFYSNAVDRRLLLLKKAVRDGVVEICKAPGYYLSTANLSKCRAKSRMTQLVRENYLQSRGIRGRGGQGKTDATTILAVASLYRKPGGLNIILAQHDMHDFTCRHTVG